MKILHFFIISFSFIFSQNIYTKDLNKNSKTNYSFNNNTNILATFYNDDVPIENSEKEKRKNIFDSSEEKNKIKDIVEYQFGFITEAGIFNNADFRNLNKENLETIEYTDDKLTIAVSRFFINIFFPLTERLFFKFDLYKNGFWGNDNLSSDSSKEKTFIGSNPFLFGELYTEAFFIKNENTTLSLKVGRQFFDIGGIKNDFILRDYLDAFSISIYNNNTGTLRILAVDFLALNSNAAHEINYLRYFSRNTNSIDNFDGDVNALRTGAVYESKDLMNWNAENKAQKTLEAKVYGFYARYGAVFQTGADRTTQGEYDNFADNDWSAVFGSRWLYSIENLNFYVEYAVSQGIDRKLKSFNQSNRDIKTDGTAYGGGLIYNFKTFSTIDIILITNSFYSSGPVYDEYGIQKSYGFTSFKGSHAGGLLFNKYNGFHPSAHTETSGIQFNSYGYERSSGTLSAHTSFQIIYNKILSIKFDGWFFADTGKSKLKNTQTNLEEKQKRLGQYTGSEADILFEYVFENYLTMYMSTAIFIPGSFYKNSASTDILIQEPQEPMGKNNFWGFVLGTKLVF
ncbi:MAG: hypothetical protein OEZ22_02720 [Spirochaetia bacterium]|nr:hypothetical protein [Spirochaetia bacterium]